MLTHPAEALRLWDSVVTMGAFDGVHRGHQALIRRAVDRAARLGVPSVAYTFDPPPKAVFGDALLLGLVPLP
jgi:FAD synthase